MNVILEVHVWFCSVTFGIVYAAIVGRTIVRLLGGSTRGDLQRLDRVGTDLFILSVHVTVLLVGTGAATASSAPVEVGAQMTALAGLAGGVFAAAVGLLLGGLVAEFAGGAKGLTEPVRSRAWAVPIMAFPLFATVDDGSMAFERVPGYMWASYPVVVGLCFGAAVGAFRRAAAKASMTGDRHDDLAAF